MRKPRGPSGRSVATGTREEQSKGQEPVRVCGEPLELAEGKDASLSEQPECEILDIVCQGEEEDSEGGSELSAIAEEIVSEVLGQTMEGGGGGGRGGKEAEGGGGGGKRAVKNVRFSESLPVEDTNLALQQQTSPPRDKVRMKYCSSAFHCTLCVFG